MNIVRPVVDYSVWSFGIVVCIRADWWMFGIALGPFHFGVESVETVLIGS